LTQKTALLQNMTNKFDDCRQQMSSVEAQNAKVTKAVCQIISGGGNKSVESGNQQDDFMWEAGMLRILSSAKKDTINFRALNFNGLGMVTGVAGDNRLLFMPHSEGIYMALVLKNSSDLEREQSDQMEMMSHVSASNNMEDTSSSPLELATQISESDSSSSKPKPPV